MTSGTNNKEELKLNKEEYFNVAVSFWRQASSITGDIHASLICLGALIYPDRALVTKECNIQFDPIDGIIVYTGKGYQDNHDIADVLSCPDIEDITIIGTEKISFNSNFIIQVVSNSA